MDIINNKQEKHKHIKTQEQFVSMDRYFQWVYKTISPYLGNRILDIGCAGGNICQYFLNKEKVIGVDLLDEFIEEIKRRFKNYPNFEAYKCSLVSEEFLKYQSRNVDTVTCLNVISHITDDDKALKNVYEILQPKGKLILQVPAFKWLYGTLDEADLHFRRYNKEEIIKKISLTGFLVHKVFYFNMMGIFPWYFSGKIMKENIFSSKKGKLYNIVIPFLKIIESIIKPPFGLSIFVIAQKP